MKHNKYLYLLILGIIPFFLNGIFNNYIFNKSIFLYWLFEVLIWVVMPVIIFHEIISKKYTSLLDLGLSNKKLLSIEFISCAFFTLIALLFIIRYTQNLSYELYNKNFYSLKFNYSLTIAKDGILRYLIILYHSLTAGFVEEFYYRGYFRDLVKKLGGGNFLFVFLSSFIFSLVHWENGIYTMFPAFFIGIFLALHYLKFKNLYCLVIAHVFVDFIHFYFASLSS